MDSPNPTQPAESLRCRLRLSLDRGEGTEAELELALDEWLRGPFGPERLPGLPSRVAEVLERQLLPAFRRELWRWADERVPPSSGGFEEEFVRRCDRNGDVVSALEWLAPHVESDEEREWKARMAEIFMGREENERVR